MRRVSKALRSRRNGSSSKELELRACVFTVEGISCLRMKERTGIVDEVGTTASVYSSMRARRPIFAGVKKRVMMEYLRPKFAYYIGIESPFLFSKISCDQDFICRVEREV